LLTAGTFGVLRFLSFFKDGLHLAPFHALREVGVARRAGTRRCLCNARFERLGAAAGRLALDKARDSVRRVARFRTQSDALSSAAFPCAHRAKRGFQAVKLGESELQLDLALIFLKLTDMQKAP
jgi:hypothetical protein